MNINTTQVKEGAKTIISSWVIMLVGALLTVTVKTINGPDVVAAYLPLVAIILAGVYMVVRMVRT